MAPYITCVAGVAGAILSFWTPFYWAFLTVAATVGAAAFAIQWLGIRLRAQLGVVGLLLMIFTSQASHRLLLPKNMTNTDHWLTGAEFLAVCIFFFALPHILFRVRLRRDLDDRAPTTTESS